MNISLVKVVDIWVIIIVTWIIGYLFNDRLGVKAHMQCHYIENTRKL